MRLSLASELLKNLGYSHIIKAKVAKIILNLDYLFCLNDLFPWNTDQQGLLAFLRIFNIFLLFTMH